MKVILYMATTVNGCIASQEHETPWSDAEFESYKSMVETCGNLIVGKTTYDLTMEENGYADIGEPFVVVLTSSTETPTRENTLFVKSFEEALQLLKEKGFETVLVGGGGQLDAAALESGLLEEIYLDIEPIIFGKGIPLFSETDVRLSLKLIDTKRIGESGIQLHYQVLK